MCILIPKTAARVTLAGASAILGLGLSLSLQSPAMAQQQKETCKVSPDKSDQKPMNDDSESGKLDDCNGVLHPPKVGDPEMVQPAPDVGKMPVIPPKAVPNAENQGNGADTETH